jgi:hypothetical protein
VARDQAFLGLAYLLLRDGFGALTLLRFAKAGFIYLCVLQQQLARGVDPDIFAARLAVSLSPLSHGYLVSINLPSLVTCNR